jgi:hypothetical protein
MAAQGVVATGSQRRFHFGAWMALTRNLQNYRPAFRITNLNLMIF